VTYAPTTPAPTPSTEPDGGWLCSLDLTHLTAAHATARLVDWQTALRAENKAPGTVAIYVDGAIRYVRGCTEHDRLPMSRAALDSWIAGLLDAGTARIRQLAVPASRPVSPPAVRSPPTRSSASRHCASYPRWSSR
jgi:hypothetical protein